MVSQHIGQRIRQERTKQRLTQERLAEHAGVSESYVGQIERAAKNPSLESLIKIANALGITLDYLMKDVTDVKPNMLLEELIALTSNREPDELRLLLNINIMVINYIDFKK